MCKFYESTVGKKIVMAVTGLILVGFVIGHMTGNLKAFLGFDSTGIAKLDHYAYFLREMGSSVLGHGGFLWLVRIGLLGAVLLHIISAIQLTTRNRASRPVGYATQKFSSATIASRVMQIGGALILVFIVFHILHFTTGTLHFDGFAHGHVYANVYQSFQNPALLGVYVVAMTFLCLHLFHGMWSMLQTLGIDAPGWNKAIRRAVQALALAIFFGFISVPLAVYAGILPPPSTHFIETHE